MFRSYIEYGIDKKNPFTKLEGIKSEKRKFSKNH